MASSNRGSTLNVPLGPITTLLGVFALVGFGIGATGAVALTQLGADSAIFSGVIFLIILTVAFLLGPLVAVFGGIQIGESSGRSPETYLASAVGAIGGYGVMMLTVIVVLSIAMSITGGGGAGAAGSGSVSSTTQSSGVDWMQYLVPMVGVALPTGIVGVGGAILGSRQADSDTERLGRRLEIPTRPALAVAGAVLLVGAAVVGAAALTPGGGINLSSGDPSNISVPVSGVQSSGGEALTLSATVEHTGDTIVETTMTAQLMVDGETYEKWTSNQRVTLQPGESRQVSWTIADLNDGGGVAGATEEQQSHIDQGNYRVRILVNDEVVYSTPA